MLRRLLPSLLLSLSLLFAAALPAAAQDRFSITILHTNDVHSRLQQINRFDVICNEREAAERQCAGGSARLMTRVRQLQAEITQRGGNWLLLDAGDQFQGSLFYSHYKGEAEARMMTAIGYQAMAVGNHEFDDGPAGLARFVGMVRFPILSANLDLSREPALQNLVRPYTILEVGGRRIGIIGATTEDTPETSTPGPTVGFRRAEEILPPIIQRLRGERVNAIILLSHLGLPRDQQVAAAVEGITAIVGGHSHTLLSNRIAGAAGPYPVMARGPGGGNVPIVQAAAFGRYLGRFELTIDANGTAAAAGGDVELLGPDVEQDPQILAEINRLAEPLEAVRRRVIGELANEVDQSLCRRQECMMGNLVSDALMWRLRGQHVQIVFSNGGGLRAGLPAGPVTFGGVLTVLPFQNTVATMRLKGADVLASLENGLSQVEQNGGRFPQVGGMRYTWDRSRPPGSRVVSAELRQPDGQYVAIDPNATYTVATNNFVRQGGDGYSAMRDRAIDPYDYGEPLEDVVAAYINSHSPLRVQLDGRITAR